MNVAVYSKPFLPNMGGLERNTLSLCLALRDAGCEVHLFTETLEEGERSYPFSITRSNSMWELFVLLRRADLFIVNGNVSLRTLPLALLRGVPYATIYANHEGYRRGGSGLQASIGNGIRKAIAERAIANIFLSEYARESSDLPTSTSYVILNPVDKRLQSLYQEQDDRGGSFFLFAGRIIEGKGIFVLMDALHELDEEMRLRIKVAGEGRAEQEMRKRARSLSSIRVKFAGRLQATELVEAYHEARALVVPSTSHKEGNPLVIPEALYAGTPVIASDQPPMIEAVGDAGIIVEQGNVNELAGAIRDVDRDEALFRDLKKTARKRAPLFDYERYAREVKELLRSIEYT